MEKLCTKIGVVLVYRQRRVGEAAVVGAGPKHCLITHSPEGVRMGWGVRDSVRRVDNTSLSEQVETTPHMLSIASPAVSLAAMDLTTAYRYNQNMMEYYTCK